MMTQSYGERIRDLRTAHKLSQQALAEKIGALSQPDISRIEHEEVLPLRQQVELIVEALVGKSRSAKVVDEVMVQVEATRARREQALATKRKERRIEAQARREAPRHNVIGRNISDRRDELRMTRTALAKRAKLHPNHLGQIELGAVLNPEESTLRRIAKALRCEVADLRKSSAAPLPVLPAPLPQLADKSAEAALRAVGEQVREPGLYLVSDLPRILAAENRPVTIAPVERDSHGHALFALFHAAPQKRAANGVH